MAIAENNKVVLNSTGRLTTVEGKLVADTYSGTIVTQGADKAFTAGNGDYILTEALPFGIFEAQLADWGCITTQVQRGMDLMVRATGTIAEGDVLMSGADGILIAFAGDEYKARFQAIGADVDIVMSDDATVKYVPVRVIK